jgi:hypothetical protein
MADKGRSSLAENFWKEFRRVAGGWSICASFWETERAFFGERSPSSIEWNHGVEGKSPENISGTITYGQNPVSK